MIRLLATLAIAAGALAILAHTYLDQDPASAGGCGNTAVTQWAVASGGNGHHYQGVCADGGATWDEARGGAEAVGGHLVSITSAAENAFVYGLIDDGPLWVNAGGGWCPGPLIGAIEPDGTQEPAGGWTWVTGEPFAYENWAGGEPNNNGGFDENRAVFGTGGCVSVQTSPEWHDVGEDDEEPSYVVEWDEAPPVCANTAVMEWPASAGGNGHFYQGVCGPGKIDWDDASAAAQAAGGYLVTATSTVENEFAFDLIDAPGFWNISYICIVGPWIGAFQPDGSQEPAGGWQWVTGEPFAFNNWAEGEPNNFSGFEDRITYWNGCPGEDGRTSTWVDLQAEVAEVIAYVVEWDANPATPSPTASPPPGAQRIWGNANCSGPGHLDPPDPVDSLLTLRHDAGLGANTGDCPALGTEVDVLNASLHTWGDVDCSGAVNPVDSLKILRFDAGLSVAQEAGCPGMGTVVTLVVD